MEAIVIYSAVLAAVALMFARLLSSLSGPARRHSGHLAFAGGQSVGLSRPVPLIQPGPRARLRTGHSGAPLAQARTLLREPGAGHQTPAAFLDSVSEEVRRLRNEMEALKGELKSLQEYADRGSAPAQATRNVAPAEHRGYSQRRRRHP
jgi:hypothetical protein